MSVIRTCISILAAFVVVGVLFGPPFYYLNEEISDVAGIWRRGDVLTAAFVGIGCLLWLGVGVWIGWIVIAEPIRSLRADRRRRARVCDRCGYDLRVDSERCPECGQFQLHGTRRDRNPPRLPDPFVIEDDQV